MGKSFSFKLALFAFSSPLGIGFALAQASKDLVTVLDGQQYSIGYYKSSIKDLPPESKKVWVITNRKSVEGETKQRIGSVRRNILFNCARNTYSTLAIVNYSEPDAVGRPILQTDTGFDLSNEPIPESSALAIVQSQVCTR